MEFFAISLLLASRGLCLLLIIFSRDPGIIPSNAHPPELERYGGNNKMGSGIRTPQMRIPRTRDVIVNGVTEKQYCDTCMLYRPPQAFHHQRTSLEQRAPQEQGLPSQSAARGFLIPNMGKAMGGIEMGRKLDHLAHLELKTDSKMVDEKDGALGRVDSSDLSKENCLPESAEGQTIRHPRHSSREMTPDALA